MVQEELKRRDEYKYSYSSKNPYSCKLICGDCGGIYGAKVWHSTDKCRKEILQCNGKYRNHCYSPNLNEDDAKEKFILAYNEVMNNKDALVEDTKAIVTMLTDTSEIDSKIQELNTEMDDIEVLVENLIHDNSKRSQSQSEYEKRYNELVDKFNKAKDEVQRLTDTKISKSNKLEVLQAFITTIEEKENFIDESSLELWNLMIDATVVNRDGTITFKFKNGNEVII